MKRMKTSWPVQQWKQCSCLPLSSNNGTNIHMHAVCHFISREIIIPDHCISYWDKYKCNYSTFQIRVKSHPGLHFCCSTMLYGLLRKLVQPSESIKCKNETTLLSVAVGEGGGGFPTFELHCKKHRIVFFVFAFSYTHSSHNLGNVLRQVNMKYFKLRSDIQSCGCNNFGVRQVHVVIKTDKKRGGVPLDPPMLCFYTLSSNTFWYYIYLLTGC